MKFYKNSSSDDSSGMKRHHGFQVSGAAAGMAAKE